jgi:hypothetical protein
LKNLLITTIGEYNHYSTWAEGRHNFDLYPIDYRITPGFKYPSIYRVFQERPDLLDYDYFWMPDEDILLAPDKIDELFRKMEQFKLDLAQPSIERSDTSFPSWEQFVHRGNTDIIYSTFVEIMCPCFSVDALKKCLETFTKSKSGWGLDLVWPKLIGDRHDNIAVINSIVAKHTRSIRGGQLYDALAKEKLLPSTERKRLMKEYGIGGLNINIHANKSILY